MVSSQRQTALDPIILITGVRVNGGAFSKPLR
jgi:hypothetical protein